jgi:hypothetical protein
MARTPLRSVRTCPSIQGVAQRHGVADTGVHALPTQRAVVVCRIPGKRDPPGVETIGDTVLNAET